jgi:hypothetical protein
MSLAQLRGLVEEVGSLDSQTICRVIDIRKYGVKGFLFKAANAGPI